MARVQMLLKEASSPKGSRLASLSDQIDKKRKEIKTDGYPVSIGEWISMYEDQELGNLCISFRFPYQFDFCKMSPH
jgi:hypothetical protein